MDDEFLGKARKARQALEEGLCNQADLEQMLIKLKEELCLRQQVRTEAEKEDEEKEYGGNPYVSPRRRG